MKSTSDYTIHVTESYKYDPDSVKEGYRLLYEYMAIAYLKDKRNRGELTYGSFRLQPTKRVNNKRNITSIVDSKCLIKLKVKIIDCFS